MVCAQVLNLFTSIISENALFSVHKVSQSCNMAILPSNEMKTNMAYICMEYHKMVSPKLIKLNFFIKPTAIKSSSSFMLLEIIVSILKVLHVCLSPDEKKNMPISAIDLPP